MTHSNKPGILLVGHGTRHALGQEEFLRTVEMVTAARPDVPVAGSFLELAQPDIPAGIAALLDRGARRIIVMPELLFEAGHAKEDIPAIVARELNAQIGGDVAWHMAPPLGCHGELVRLSARRFREAVKGHPPVPDELTMFLLVGRGGSDAEAIAECHRFAQLRGEATPLGGHAVAFLAVAQPTLTEFLHSFRPGHFKRVVIQPHLLFAGQLTGDIEEAAEEMRQKFPQVEWVVARHLGPSEELVAAILARIEDVG